MHLTPYVSRVHLAGALRQLLRLKGFAWLATRNKRQINLALAGTQFAILTY